MAMLARRSWQFSKHPLNNFLHKNYEIFNGLSLDIYGVTKRFLNISEFAGMKILSKYDVSVPMSRLANTPEEAEVFSREILEATNCLKLMVKAQVLAGGRGKGNFINTRFRGVEVVDSPLQARKCAEGMIGNKLVTKQTGEAGIMCNQVAIAEKLDLAKERYLALMLDRKSCKILLIATKYGGSNVEEIAEKSPNAVLKIPICPLAGPSEDQLAKIADHLDFSDSLKSETKTLISKLYKAFVATDSLLLEINPLAETADKKLIACDSKVTIDDNAHYRQALIFKEAPEPTNREEAEAEKAGLSYISLGGDIACIVNGAGLAMVTLDLIKYHGGSPANFLDVGGNVTSEGLSKAMEIVSSDPNAKVLLVNIVGGIVHCDKFAASFIEAAKDFKKDFPIVIRLQGTNASVAKKLLDESQIPYLFCLDFDSAAKSAVEIAKSS